MPGNNTEFKTNNPAASTDGDKNSEFKAITEQLYKQNLELAVRNKILSLLQGLYQISILTLEPEDLAKQVSKLILETLEFELAAIYNRADDSQTLKPLGLSISDRIQSVGLDVDHTLTLSDINNIADNNFRFLLRPDFKIIDGVIKLWPNLDEEQYQLVEREGHIRSSLAYPLLIEGRIIGALFIMLNRRYDELSQFEKDSLSNIVNVIAVALDRAVLDEQLKIANEKLKELDRQKTEFVSIASHQLRSPLTAIKGYSSMILENSFGEISDKVRGAVDVIFQSSQKLVLVIEDFLNITRIELGRMKYEFTETDLKEIADEVVKELERSVKIHGLELFYNPSAEKYPIHADKGKIAQVISNLIDNAAKYTKAGSIAITLSRIDRKSRLVVKDTGVGIPPEVIPKLFQKFTRADDAGKVNITGTGLGLYIAKQIVDAHGGQIWAESPGTGQGSTFYLEL